MRSRSIVSFALIALLGVGSLASADNAPMDPSDLEHFQPNLERAMDKTAGSNEASWKNRGTSHGGTITAGGDAGNGCRKFTHEYSDRGKKTTYTGVACKQANGSWTVKP